MARQPSSYIKQRALCLRRYTALYLVAWSPTLWSVGYALLQTPSEQTPGNLGTDDEVLRLTLASNSTHPEDARNISWTCCPTLCRGFIHAVRAPALSPLKFRACSPKLPS